MSSLETDRRHFTTSIHKLNSIRVLTVTVPLSPALGTPNLTTSGMGTPGLGIPSLVTPGLGPLDLVWVPPV